MCVYAGSVGSRQALYTVLLKPLQGLHLQDLSGNWHRTALDRRPAMQMRVKCPICAALYQAGAAMQVFFAIHQDEIRGCGVAAQQHLADAPGLHLPHCSLYNVPPTANA